MSSSYLDALRPGGKSEYPTLGKCPLYRLAMSTDGQEIKLNHTHQLYPLKSYSFNEGCKFWQLLFNCTNISTKESTFKSLGEQRKI